MEELCKEFVTSQDSSNEVPTSTANITLSESLVLPIGVVYSVVSSQLNDVGYRCIVGYRNSLTYKSLDKGMPRRYARTQTLGLPVVPLEKLRNATFVLPSPGCSTRSWKVDILASPSSMTSWTVIRVSYNALFTLNSMIRSAGSSVARAAASATDNDSGCVMITEALVACI